MALRSHRLRLVGLLVLCARIAIAASPNAPAKLWSVDLVADSNFHERLSVQEVSLSPPHVNFLNDSQILLDFYSEEKIGFNPTLAKTRYHVLEIDAHTGVFAHKLDFQPVDDNSRALPVADGGFVVRAEGELRKFNSKFEPGVNYPTPIETSRGQTDLWLMDVSPSGKTITLYHRHTSKDDGEFTRLQSSDLSVESKSPTGLHLVLRTSDTGLITEKSRILCDQCAANFLTNDLYFIEQGRASVFSSDRYVIETTAGEKRASGKLDTGKGDLARSQHATRVAFLSGHYNGTGFPIKSNFASLSGKITVLDWSLNKRVAEIDVEEPAGNPSDGLTQSALALSPDGKMLLVVLHHTLTCYRLP